MEKDFSVFEWLSSNNTSVVGIDINPTTVKLLEISQVGARFRVESYATTPIPAGAIDEKAIKEPAVVADVVKKTIQRSKTTAMHSAVAVADSSVITKVVQMAADLSEDEVETQIILEAGKHIPYPLEEVSLDFDILGSSHQNEECVDVLLAASRSENVHSRVDAVEEAGMAVRVVDVESYAVERACYLIRDSLPNRGTDQIIAVVDIGSTMINLTVLHNFSTVFTREELFGEQQLAADVQKNPKVLEPFKEAVVLQVRRALQFFFSASQHNKVSHIVLIGGAVSVPGLAETIQEQIGITASIANPFGDMTIAKRVDVAALTQDAPALMICCGLALRGFDKNTYAMSAGDG